MQSAGCEIASMTLNLLKIMSFNQRHIEPSQLAVYLHFLLVPGEHELGCRFLSSFLQQIQRTLKGESFFGDILAELKILIDTKSSKLPDHISIASKLDFDGIPLDLLITDNRFSILIEIQANGSEGSRLHENYQYFIRHFPIKAGHRILCVVIGRENHPSDNFMKDLRQVDRLTFMGFDEQADSTPSLKTSLINIFHRYGYDFNDNIVDTKNSDYPPGLKLLQDLSQFISSNMQGYGYHLNPNDIPGITYINSSQLMKKSEGYVYITNGLSGLLRMRHEQIETFQFGFVVNQQNTSGWLSVKRVNSYLKWFLSSSGSDSKAIISRRTKKRYRRGKCSKY